MTFAEKLVSLILRQRFMVIGAAVLLAVWGIWAFMRLPIEAYPDVAPLKVQIISQWPGRGSEEVERGITVPVEAAIAGLPKMASIRSISLFGLSVVTVIFEDDADNYQSRQQILSRVNSLTLPAGVNPNLSPDSGATGELYRYTLEGEGIDVMELKTLQDWVLEREFKKVPGVVDVVSFGGPIKQYHIQVDPLRLKNYNIAVQQLFNAVAGSNNNIGANTIDHGEESYVVRGIGLIRNVSDLEQIVLASRGGTPVQVKDVATVSIGSPPRLGLVGKDKKGDVAEGIVLARRGENALEVLGRVKEKVLELNQSILPSGVKIKPYYDRTDLIHMTTHTVFENLIVGIALVVGILLLFLGNLRSAFIVTVTIPLSLLFAFIVMERYKVPANLLSLGAVDFGIIVNAAVIIVEHIFSGVVESKGENIFEVIQHAAKAMFGAIFFSTAVIIAAYIPLFAMEGVEARIFTPMAFTMGFALLASLLLSFTLVPVLSYYLLKGKAWKENTPIMTFCQKALIPLLKKALRFPKMSFSVAILFFLLSIAAAPFLGTEFLPTLEEGNIWLRATLPMTTNLSYASKIVDQTRGLLLTFPEVDRIVSQLGRPDDGTDATGFFNAEYGIYLKPFSAWRSGMTKPKLISEMEKKLSVFPGISYNFSQAIQDNVNEAVSGVKGSNSVKFYGADLRVLEQKAADVAGILKSVPGVKDVGIFRELGQPAVNIEIDRKKCARYGISVSDLENIIQLAIGGQSATEVIEGEKRFDVVIRWQPKYRQDLNSISNLLVDAQDGQRIPLSQLASITTENGPALIYRENHSRFIPIKFGVGGRDLGSTILEAQAKVKKSVSLPFGYHVEWSGEFGEMKRAQERLAITIPLSLCAIWILLYLAFHSFRDTLLIFINVPLALAGGIFTLLATHTNFSVSAAIGFVSLFGIAVENGVVLITFFNELRRQGVPLEEAIIKGVEARLRPVLMTALLAALGLLPAAISTGIGSQAQKPLAMVIVGGAISATFLTLIILPLCYRYISKFEPPSGKESPPGSKESGGETPAEKKAELAVN